MVDAKQLQDDGNMASAKTMRQYYKAMAMQGLLSGQYAESSKFNLSSVPKEAGLIADAMLAEDREHENRCRQLGE